VAEPAILVDGLTRDFGQMRAVDDVSFEVPMGSIFGFLGPNGAGKTTTINLFGSAGSDEWHSSSFGL